MHLTFYGEYLKTTANVIMKFSWSHAWPYTGTIRKYTKPGSIRRRTDDTFISNKKQFSFKKRSTSNFYFVE